METKSALANHLSQLKHAELAPFSEILGLYPWWLATCNAVLTALASLPFVHVKAYGFAQSPPLWISVAAAAVAILYAGAAISLYVGQKVKLRMERAPRPLRRVVYAWNAILPVAPFVAFAVGIALPLPLTWITPVLVAGVSAGCFMAAKAHLRRRLTQLLED